MTRKRTILFLIIFTLIIATTIVSFASPYNDTRNSPYEDAIVEMSRLGILEGIGNDLFNPKGELNRAAGAKVAAYLLGYTVEDAIMAASWEPLFSDIVGTPHQWALGWINLMAKDGILQGVGENRYSPGAPLQMVHWVTILTRILQHETKDMTWPTDYNELAIELGFDSNLNYIPTNIMTREQMSQMTYISIYEIPRPDGQRIIDIVQFNIVDFDDASQSKEINYVDTRLSVSLNKNVVPSGGNQTVDFTVRATYGPNNIPASNTRIEFFADAGGSITNHRFSEDSTLTDDYGYAKAKYTTNIEDNNKVIKFKAVVSDGDNWNESSVYLLVSNNSATLKGTVLNPFNGNPVDNASIILVDRDTRVAFSYDEGTASNGTYSLPVIPGRYYVNFEMNIGDSNPYDNIFKGSHHELRSDGKLVLTYLITLSKDETHILNSHSGIVSGVASNLREGTEVYFVPSVSSNTRAVIIGPGGRFVVPLAPDRYDIYSSTGTIYKRSVIAEKGKIIDIGSF